MSTLAAAPYADAPYGGGAQLLIFTTSRVISAQQRPLFVELGTALDARTVTAQQRPLTVQGQQR